MNVFEMLAAFLKNLRDGTFHMLIGAMFVFAFVCVIGPLALTLMYGNCWYLLLYVITFPIGYALGESACEFVDKKNNKKEEGTPDYGCFY